ERLIEDGVLVVFLHEYRVQSPVEILARGDAGDLDRANRVNYRAGPDSETGCTQRAGEQHDIVHEPSRSRHRGAVPGHSAALSSAFTSSRIAAARLPRTRAISS